MNPRVAAVVRKELREYRRNRMVLVTMAVLPVIFLAITLLGELLVPADTPAKSARTVAGMALLLFLTVPLMIPSTVAAYSVVGEREQGTLEPTLTTPVSDRELLVGKAVAALVPAVAISWLLFAVFIVAAVLFAAPVMVQAMWDTDLLTATLLAPALAGLSIVIGLTVSVRSTDIRAAEQLATFAWLPFMMVLALITYGVLAPSNALFLLGALVLLAVDAAGWLLAVTLFDRELLLTRAPGWRMGAWRSRFARLRRSGP